MRKLRILGEEEERTEKMSPVLIQREERKKIAIPREKKKRGLPMGKKEKGPILEEKRGEKGKEVRLPPASLRDVILPLGARKKGGGEKGRPAVRRPFAGEGREKILSTPIARSGLGGERRKAKLPSMDRERERGGQTQAQEERGKKGAAVSPN